MKCWFLFTCQPSSLRTHEDGDRNDSMSNLILCYIVIIYIYIYKWFEFLNLNGRLKTLTYYIKVEN